MVAANVFHWWLGVVLAGVGILATVGVAAGYLRKVTAMQYPKRPREE